MQADKIIGKYAIGGAIGAAFYLEPTSSFDIDIFLSFKNMPGNPLAPLQGIYDYLKPMGCTLHNEHIIIAGWPVQFIPAEDDLLEEALTEANETDVRGVKTWVIRAEHLIAVALRLGRRKDEARVERFIEIGNYDQTKLNDILTRYGLLVQWKQISDNYNRPK